MDQFSSVFAVFSMLLGPIKLIPTFAAVTQGSDDRFKRSVAIKGIVIASALCVFVALAGGRPGRKPACRPSTTSRGYEPA
jgi:small neutral amino acid transporter SnatA (MarC family)